METLILIIVLGTSAWMAFDAHQIGYRKGDVKGMAGMGPLGWLVAGLLLWIVAFPLYLASRSKLKAAAGKATPSASSDASPPAPTATVTATAERGLPSRIGRGFVNGVYAFAGFTAVAVVLGLWMSTNGEDATDAGQRNSDDTLVVSSIPQSERTTATSQSGPAHPEMASMVAEIKADTSPLAMQVKRFCAGKGDKCLVYETVAALEVFELSRAHAPGSPQHTALSSCFNRFGNGDGSGDYVRIKGCVSDGR